MFNPQGAVLPPKRPLEADYRRVLQAEHGVRVQPALCPGEHADPAVRERARAQR